MDRHRLYPHPSTRRVPGALAARVAVLVAAVAFCNSLTALSAAAAGPSAAAPTRLADTGLYADFARRTIGRANLPFSPQYPLWTDGATKRRWILIPEGSSIDASNVDAWVFPVGTKLWKEFAHNGRPVETRYMERTADGEWLYATYQWTKDGRDARLASERGVRGAAESKPGIPHDLPGTWDCRACHEGRPSRVLGFSALQLSSDRDPLAPHQQQPEPGSVDLDELIVRGLVRGLPVRFLRTPPRIPARSPVERAALGYLHGNCAGCHNGSGPLADLGLSLEVLLVPAHGPGDSGLPEAIATGSSQVARFELKNGHSMLRIAPGEPDASLLARRMGSRQSLRQMPPLGTNLVDGEAVALVRAWIRELEPPYRLVTPQHSASRALHRPIPSTLSAHSRRNVQ